MLALLALFALLQTVLLLLSLILLLFVLALALNCVFQAIVITDSRRT